MCLLSASPSTKRNDEIRTRHIYFFQVGAAGCGGADGVGQVAPCAVVNVLHLRLQLAQTQHDVVQQHGEGLLQICA